MRYIIPLIILSSCAPVVIGTGVVATGSMLGREKGISGSFSDISLASKVRQNLVKREETWGKSLFQNVSVAVQNSEVLLTGYVTQPEESAWAEQAIWEIFGVKQVINQISVENKPTWKSSWYDTRITTTVKTEIFKLPNVRSLNYSIKTVNGIVYVMGISKNIEERDKVLDVASRIEGVKKVVCLARTKKEVLS